MSLSGAVSFSHLASGAVSFSHLASGAVSFSHVASGALSSGSISILPEVRREQDIRASVPLLPTTPAWVVADWLYDNMRDDDAAFMRMRMSGG